MTKEFVQGLESHRLDDAPGRNPYENAIESILSPEQVRFLERDRTLEQLCLNPDATIGFLETIQEETDELRSWRSKEGVIDAGIVEGVIIIVFNADKKVPEGCRDLRVVEGPEARIRSGEYDSEKNICSIDISDSWSYAFNTYSPELLSPIVRHEVRHGLVTLEDRRYVAQTKKPGIRNIEDTLIEPEELRQLTYLDELHSQYFDLLEGSVQGKTSFRSIDSNFYSTLGRGSHTEVATTRDELKEVTMEIFYILQACDLSQRMSEAEPGVLARKIRDVTASIGAVLGTERSLLAVREKVTRLFAILRTDEAYCCQIEAFLSRYKATFFENDNTPLLTPELLSVWKR
jgi:hypothetical protein